MKVRYTTQWLRSGYYFPLVKVFEGDKGFSEWKRDMTSRYGINFHIMQTWEDVEIPDSTAPRTARPLTEGGEDARIIGMGY